MQLQYRQNSNQVIRFLSMLLFACITQTAMATPAAAEKNKVETPRQKAGQPPAQAPAISFQQADSIPALLEAGRIQLKDRPNPHWNKNGCIACHKSTAANASAKNLRHESVAQGCYNCHSPAFDHRYIHPVNIKPGRKMLDDMEPAMRSALAKSNNQVTCTSCHDMTLQCRTDSKKWQTLHPKFFRNGPYESRSQLCFTCHDKDEYQRLNPHDQIDDKGNVRPEKCYVCHADSLARLKHVREIDQMEFYAEDTLASMCWGCHPWTPHPGGQFTFFKSKAGPNHLVKPSEKIKQRMEESAEEYLLYFPLEPGSGKIFCATCHNVHEKGVIKEPVKARGADSKRRLRDPKICEYCHLK